MVYINEIYSNLVCTKPDAQTMPAESREKPELNEFQSNKVNDITLTRFQNSKLEDNNVLKFLTIKNRSFCFINYCYF